MPRHGEQHVQMRADGFCDMHMRVADGVGNDCIRLQAKCQLLSRCTRNGAQNPGHNITHCVCAI